MKGLICKKVKGWEALKQLEKKAGGLWQKATVFLLPPRETEEGGRRAPAALGASGGREGGGKEEGGVGD